MADYRLEDLEARAEESRLANADYLAKLEAAYADRRHWRCARRLPTIGICGFGRSGKDTAAEMLASLTPGNYSGSTSSVVLPIVARAVCLPPQQAWQERHANRQFWLHFCHAFRGKDYAKLARMNLAHGEFVVGIRGREELFVAAQECLDMTIWIANSRAADCGTVEYGPEDCDLVLPNYGSRLEFYRRLRKFVELFSKGFFNNL